MKKIYIAGPDVFEPNSIEIGKEYVQLCKDYGYEGLYPLDNIVDFNQEKNKIAQDIYIANKKLIEKSDIVIANLNAFRGKEPDSGTIWECGYATALGKKVYGYMQKNLNYIDTFSENEKILKDDIYIDSDGKTIEDFDYPLNLMISCSVEDIVFGNFKDVLKYIEENK